jgi:hypothetical protein
MPRLGLIALPPSLQLKLPWIAFPCFNWNTIQNTQREIYPRLKNRIVTGVPRGVKGIILVVFILQACSLAEKN